MRKPVEDPREVTEADAIALVRRSPTIDRLDRIEARTTTWGSLHSALPLSQRLGGDRSAIDPATVVRVVAVGGAVHHPRLPGKDEYNWLIVVIDASTGEHYSTAASIAPDAWPPYFDGLPSTGR